MIGFVAFAVVLLIFTTLVDMPFLEHAYQFIATKVEHSHNGIQQRCGILHIL
ncbi:hypothetical protein J4714_11755 [Staphylococcus epidermidis]|nr:hypothetical protein [Staphylococcus epidermidis]